MIFETKERKIVKEVEGIGVFSFKNAQLTAGVSELFDFEVHDTVDNTGRLKKYQPFDSLGITNNGEDEITVYFNDTKNQFQIIPKGTIWNWKAPSEIPMVWKIRVKNTGTTATITANKIVISVSRRGTDADSYAKARAKNVFTSFFERFIGG